MYGGGSLLEMKLLKDVRLKLEVRDYHGFRFRLDNENSKIWNAPSSMCTGYAIPSSEKGSALSLHKQFI